MASSPWQQEISWMSTLMKVHSPLPLEPLLTVLDTICSSHCVPLDCVSIQKCTRLMGLLLSSFLCLWMQSGIVLPVVSSLILHTMSSSIWRRYTTYSSQVDTGLTWVRCALVTDQLSHYNTCLILQVLYSTILLTCLGNSLLSWAGRTSEGLQNRKLALKYWYNN